MFSLSTIGITNNVLQEKAQARESLFAAHRVLSTLTREDQREEHANYLRLAEELDAALRMKACTYTPLLLSFALY